MKRMAALMWVVVFFCGLAIGQKQTRPRVLGVAHMALYVSDLQASRAFYKDFLGFAEPFVLKRDDGSDCFNNSKKTVSLIGQNTLPLFTASRSNTSSFPLGVESSLANKACLRSSQYRISR